MQRRQFLGLATLLAMPLKLLAQNYTLTPDDVEGPFYPVETIPMRSQLINDSSGLNKQIMQLQGQLLNEQGKPLSGAKIEIWQCDPKGLYDHPNQHQTQDFDNRFAGFGAQLTDDQGRYKFTTLYPVPYTGRPPHIHVKVWQNSKELLTTQLYLQGNTGGFWSRAKREPLQINPKLRQNGRFEATYDFVV